MEEILWAKMIFHLLHEIADSLLNQLAIRHFFPFFIFEVVQFLLSDTFSYNWAHHVLDSTMSTNVNPEWVTVD